MANLSITAAQVLPVSGSNSTGGTAGEAIAPGNALYLDAVTGKLKLGKSGGTAAEADCVGFALNTASLDQPVTYTNGTLTLGAGAAPVVGMAYALSATYGTICPYADLVSTNKVVFLGIGAASNQLAVRIFNSLQSKP